MKRGSLWRLLLLLAIYVVAVPVLFVWAFFLVDVSADFDLNGFVKLLWWVVMLLPVVGALWLLGMRTRRVMTRFAADGVTPATTGVLRWLAWAMIGVLCFTGILVLAVAAFAAFLALSQPGAPGAFYAAPSPLPSDPLGTVIRSEPLDGAPEGAVAWKILYLSTSHTGEPTAVSATLVVPTTPPPTGGAPGCRLRAWHGRSGPELRSVAALLLGRGHRWPEHVPDGGVRRRRHGLRGDGHVRHASLSCRQISGDERTG